jgi:hypothetical protein
VPRVVTLEEWWERYGWEPCTGPMRNTIARSSVIPDEVRHAWNVATQVEREAIAKLVESMDKSTHVADAADAIRARGNP